MNACLRSSVSKVGLLNSPDSKRRSLAPSSKLFQNWLRTYATEGAHSEYRSLAPLSKLCQNWLRTYATERALFYLRAAAVHRHCQRPPKGFPINRLNRPDPIRKRFCYGQLWPLRPACSHNRAGSRMPVPTSRIRFSSIFPNKAWVVL